jgi:creatinine amidohydrolase/Fe(II)-dependent formamide hydrolase-like protein
MDDTAGKDIYRIERLTYEQARECVSAAPAVILPLGGCEPFGGVGAMGAETLCADGISQELSVRCRILSAPAIPFGCSTPFISFTGAFGVKPRTFVNMLCEIIRAYVFQGAARVFLISAAPFNKEPAIEAVKRIEGKHHNVKVISFDINALVSVGNAVSDIDRNDAALLSMAAYLSWNGTDSSGGVCRNFQHTSGIAERKRAGIDKYRTWKKRGADPQKLRKLFPDGLLLPPDNEMLDVSPRRGKELFDCVVESIQKRIEAAMESICQPSNDGDLTA